MVVAYLMDLRVQRVCKDPKQPTTPRAITIHHYSREASAGYRGPNMKKVLQGLEKLRPGAYRNLKIGCRFEKRRKGYKHGDEHKYDCGTKLVTTIKQVTGVKCVATQDWSREQEVSQPQEVAGIVLRPNRGSQAGRDPNTKVKTTKVMTTKSIARTNKVVTTRTAKEVEKKRNTKAKSPKRPRISVQCRKYPFHLKRDGGILTKHEIADSPQVKHSGSCYWGLFPKSPW